MRRDIPPLAEVRRTTEKKRDAWWTVLLVDPLATPLVRWTAMWTRITPNQITWAALFLGLGAAACFATGSWGWLLAGAALYHLSFILDCMDGKLARLTGTGTVFGAWLDYVFDRVRVLVCAIALMGGQYSRTGDVVFLWLALAVVFLDMLRYVDALQIFKIRHGMRKQIKARARAARRADDERRVSFMEDLLRENPEADFDQEDRTAADDGPEPARHDAGMEGETAAADAAVLPGARPAGPVIDLHQEFKSRFPWYGRFRNLLLRHRIRTHLVSGIEFQMAVFIIAPAVGAVAPVTIGAAALLLVFELAIIYKLLLSTRDFTRTLESFDAAGAEAAVAAAAVAPAPAPAPEVPSAPRETTTAA
ncbi:CDP-alcohol phosphatidyltransferase family protein [Streptomyces sp. S07_1.15]|uniref:CDP-alcohol phosphatidyltransferase family protein n=1 Tax=Streptomyces sp. S07_1.15 TaxID=2873925 RepID=UPI001D1389E3|nr:CDP-alcohol phosphatidyltransferase family protein [Streptomyces sp. S07_1.15]MCC3651078.1 CDP-alcohol phosphatidyltransferase family protein [Streptomyces sp. S07_1.15]